jgi:nucleoid DNA-binding protein
MVKAAKAKVKAEDFNRTDLVKAIAKEHEFSVVQATAIFDSIIDKIKDTVEGGGEVQIMGFGKFFQHVSPARKGRNPKTGETVAIPERKSMKFKAGAKLRKL